MRKLLPDCEIRFVRSEDGSGKGAAMVTAVAYRLAAQHKARQKILEALKLSHEQLLEVKRRMRVEMEKGLGKDTHAEATVKMLPTYVCSTPDGTGEGAFMSCTWHRAPSVCATEAPLFPSVGSSTAVPELWGADAEPPEDPAPNAAPLAGKWHLHLLRRGFSPPCLRCSLLSSLPSRPSPGF